MGACSDEMEEGFKRRCRALLDKIPDPYWLICVERTKTLLRNKCQLAGTGAKHSQLAPPKPTCPLRPAHASTVRTEAGDAFPVQHKFPYFAPCLANSVSFVYEI